MMSWAESYESNVLRTEMEMSGYVKVRRRSTGKTMKIEASVTLESKHYDDIQTWFFVNSQAGVLPTRIKRPQDGKEIVVRFTEPPAIQFVDKKAFDVSFKFEQLPSWSLL
jgi:alpha-mannosidase